MRRARTAVLGVLPGLAAALALGVSPAGCGGKPGGAGPTGGRRVAPAAGSAEAAGREREGAGAAADSRLLERIRVLAVRERPADGEPGAVPAEGQAPSEARPALTGVEGDGSAAPSVRSTGAAGPDTEPGVPPVPLGAALLADLLPPVKSATGILPLPASSGRATPGRATPGAVPGAAAAPGRRLFAHVLYPGDEIDLVVAGQPEFSGHVRVRDDGTVALPTTGDLVTARGRTVAAFARAVSDAVSPRYVKRTPAVSAVLRRSPRMVYYVFGAVRRQGRYEIPPGGATVLDAVIRASGVAEPTPPKQPRLRRPDGGGTSLPGAVTAFEPVDGARYDRVLVVSPGRDAPVARKVDVTRAMRGGPEALARLLPGEIVIVPAESGPWSEKELRKREIGAPSPHAAGGTGGAR